jgi:hypothetical protein
MKKQSFKITITVDEINGYLKAVKINSTKKDIQKWELYGLIREALKLSEHLIL